MIRKTGQTNLYSLNTFISGLKIIKKLRNYFRLIIFNLPVVKKVIFMPSKVPSSPVGKSQLQHFSPRRFDLAKNLLQFMSKSKNSAVDIITKIVIIQSITKNTFRLRALPFINSRSAKIFSLIYVLHQKIKRKAKN